MLRVALKPALTLSRSAGWILLDNSSNVTVSLIGTAHRSKALSSIVKRSVSTFQVHSATPPASNASKTCFADHP